jgi:hypothetical protein
MPDVPARGEPQAATELDPGKEPMQRTMGAGSACMLARTLPLRLVEQDVLPADYAELERGIEHRSAPWVGGSIAPAFRHYRARPATKSV